MALASIECSELPAAIATFRIWLASEEVEVRESARSWVAIGDALIEGRDVGPAMRDFNEVVELLRLPAAQRIALLQLREAVNEITTETESE
jgi:hypothetical protein